MHDDDETPPYSLNTANGLFEVLDASGNVVVVCQTKPNASQYQVLLNEAFSRGYKAGYRHAKKL